MDRCIYTLPKTKSLPLKMDGWKATGYFSFGGRPIFREKTVSFRKSTMRVHTHEIYDMANTCLSHTCIAYHLEMFLEQTCWEYLWGQFRCILPNMEVVTLLSFTLKRMFQSWCSEEKLSVHVICDQKHGWKAAITKDLPKTCTKSGSSELPRDPFGFYSWLLLGVKSDETSNIYTV